MNHSVSEMYSPSLIGNTLVKSCQRSSKRAYFPFNNFFRPVRDPIVPFLRTTLVEVVRLYYRTICYFQEKVEAFIMSNGTRMLA